MPSHLRIWKNYILSHWPVYVLGFLMVGLANVMQVATKKIIGYVIDFLGQHPLPAFLEQFEREQQFYYLVTAMVLASILLTLGRIGWRATLGRESHRVGGLLKTKIWDRVRFLSPELLGRKYTKGELMNASTSDTGTARFIFGWTLVAVADVLFLTTLTVVSMFAINVSLSIYSLCVLILIPLFIQQISKIEMNRYKVAQEYLSQFNDLVSQAIASIRLQRVTHTGGFWRKKLSSSAQDYRCKRIQAINTSLSYMPIMGVTTLICYAILFFLGLDYTLSGKITPGEFVTMQGLILLIEDPLFNLGYIISEFRKASVSLKRLEDIYTAPCLTHLMSEGLSVGAKNATVLQLNGVSFRYPESTGPIINDMSLTLRQGDRLGIMGPIGAGKSTLVNILSGLERRFEGEVLFQGKEFGMYSHESLRGYMSIVSQKPFLFADSIRNNVSMGDDLTEEEIWHFLHLAGLDDDVRSFKDELDTPLGEWGINLSGGQKQRLTLARALASRPQLLFLDDCLSAVDTVTEQKILKNLNANLKDVTLVWVAHRASTLKYCDSIIEMNS